MDEVVKTQVIDHLIRKTKMIVETVYFDTMMGVQPILKDVLPDDVETDNLVEYMLQCCSEVLTQEITVEGTISMEEGFYISMIIYPMITGEDVTKKIEEIIPESHMQWLAKKLCLESKSERLLKRV